jgi:hypothetical protein
MTAWLYALLASYTSEHSRRLLMAAAAAAAAATLFSLPAEPDIQVLRNQKLRFRIGKEEPKRS